MVFCYFFFFKDVFEKFSDNLTNMATREEPYKKDGVTGIKSPAITLCFSPSIKPSVLKKYNLTTLSFFNFADMVKTMDISFSKVMYEGSLRLGKDFDVKVQKYPLKETLLKIGMNVVISNESGNKENILVQEFPTPMFGYCYLLQPSFQLGVADYFQFSVIYNGTELKDPKVNLYFTTDYDYLGVASGIWQNLTPLRVDVDFTLGNIIIDIKESKFDYVYCDKDSPYKSFQDCFTKKFRYINFKKCKRCSNIFNRAYEVYLNDSFLGPDCTPEEEACVINKEFSEWLKIPDECPLQCNRTQYTATLTESANLDITDSGVKSADFVILSGSNTKTINQEYWVYDTVGLIGAIGGSLGLFIGFSFFDCICVFIDLLSVKLTTTK